MEATEQRYTVEQIQSEIATHKPKIDRIVSQVAQVIVGQQQMIERLLIGLLADGHVLVEGVPGLAKTTAVKALAQSVQASFQRIQFTPDLLPADLLGTEVFQPKTGEFAIKKGPLFHHIILADEINRAPAKVQSALLEAMQEKQITIGARTFRLAEPFLVLATQNPIEQEGTYPLPEAQVDRFMLKLKIGYPSVAEEVEIVRRVEAVSTFEVEPVVTIEDLLKLRQVLKHVLVEDRVADYAVRLVHATRDPRAYGLEIKPLIRFGASPRASINLTRAARAYAMLQGRSYVTPYDVKSIGMDVLRHRVLLSYEAEAEDLSVEDVILQIFDSVEVP